MIKEAITKVVERKGLTEQEAVGVMNEIMNGEATPAQISSFITALRMKGETVEEITGCAKVMREKATTIKVKKDDLIDIEEETILDTCGTGGDKTNTFNISTTVAFVVAGAGIKVAKHGNRSVSSQCGSADILEALGVNLNVTPQVVEQCINEIGIGFLYAPLLHGAMKHAIGPRREIGIRTIFNILGPLTNPAQATAQVLGVYSSDLTEKIASVLGNMGTKRAMVVHGMDGLDEISTVGETKISEFKDGKVNTYYIKPEDFGIKRAKLEDINGGNVNENVLIIMDILNGKSGAGRDIVLLNAAAAFVVAGKAETISKGIPIAAESIDSGAALDKLEKLKELTNE